MSTITTSRSDLTTVGIVFALRQGLGTRYHVRAGIGTSANPGTDRVPDQPDTILVATGSNRLFRAEVVITRHFGHTVIEVHPGGLPGTFPGGLKLINRVWIARKTHQVLVTAVGPG
jgi:hypothetical protein